MKKTIAFLFICLSLFFTAACNGGELTQEQLKEGAPDYSDSTLQMPLFGYAPPGDGTYVENGVTYNVGEDFRTEERYREYADSGLNILMLDGDNSYSGENFATSQLKKNMDNAELAGLDVIVFDARLHHLTTVDGGLIGEGKLYATAEDLQAYIRECVEPYAAHPAFYGVTLLDEPSYEKFQAIGEFYHAYKAVLPDGFAQVNLLPLNDSATGFYCEPSSEDVTVRYRKYLEGFYDATGADYIMFDSYPMAQTNSGEYNIRARHAPGLQIAAEVAKERGLDVFVVCQTCSHSSAGVMQTRKCNKADMYWQTNLLMGFGVKQISYFTYWRKRVSSTSGEWFYNNGSSFMTTEGEKTELYYAMQTIHEEMQKLAPTILNFDYSGCTYELGQPLSFSSAQLSGLKKSAAMINVEKLEVGAGDMGLLTELVDKDSGQTLYMLQNALDPALSREFRGLEMEAKITFKGIEKKRILVYDKGEPTYYALESDGSFTFELSPGYAVFILPY